MNEMMQTKRGPTGILSLHDNQYLCSMYPAPAPASARFFFRYLSLRRSTQVNQSILLDKTSQPLGLTPQEVIDAICVWGAALISISYLHLLTQHSKTIRQDRWTLFQCNRGGTFVCRSIVARLREAAIYTPSLKSSCPALRFPIECICSCAIRYSYTLVRRARLLWN